VGSNDAILYFSRMDKNSLDVKSKPSFISTYIK